jgi:hypothetical protein
MDFLPFGEDNDFFLANYLPALGVRGLALIALTSRRNLKEITKLVSNFTRAHFFILIDGLEQANYIYWSLRRESHHIHSQPGTLIWNAGDNNNNKGLVRLIEKRVFASYTVACDPIVVRLVESDSTTPYETNVRGGLQHYPILTPALEMAVARMRLKDIEEKISHV